MITESLPYTLAVGAAALAAGYLAYRLGDLTLATAAGVVGAYTLHLLSVGRLRRRFRDARVLERLSAQVEETITGLPDPCIAPIVFVTSPAGAWFASSGF